jgi:hypothetical protein
MAPAMHLVLFRLQQQLRCPFLAPNVSFAKRFSPSIQRPNFCEASVLVLVLLSLHTSKRQLLL